MKEVIVTMNDGDDDDNLEEDKDYLKDNEDNIVPM